VEVTAEFAARSTPAERAQQAFPFGWPSALGA
jgi:hypothetical protein